MDWKLPRDTSVADRSPSGEPVRDPVAAVFELFGESEDARNERIARDIGRPLERYDGPFETASVRQNFEIRASQFHDKINNSIASWLNDPSEKALKGIDTAIMECETNLREFQEAIFIGAFGIIAPADDEFVDVESFRLNKLLGEEERNLRYIHGLLDDKDHSLSQEVPSLAERLSRLSRFAESQDDAAVKGYAQLLLPEWGIGNEVAPLASVPMTIPTKAPEIYPGLRSGETPPAFVKRVYGPYLGTIDKAHIRKLDVGLWNAMKNWLSRPGNEWPADVDLPTRGEMTRRTIESLRESAPNGEIGRVMGDFTAREANRIRSAIYRHQK